MEELATLSHEQARAFYDRFGAKQDAQAFYEEPALRDLVAQGDFGTARAVFELGCGTGRFAELLLDRHLPPETHYVGVDLSSTMVELARRRLERFAGRAEVRQTDGTARIASADASFDRFVATYVFDLLSRDDIIALLGEAHRVLAPEGFLCVTGLTPGTTVASRFVIRVWTTLHRLRPSLVGGCRPLELRSFLGEADWEIRHGARVTPFGVPSEVVVAMRRRLSGQSS
jgi:ubiquinone/menaquinone biosynthesis C-methylase UbiE